MAGLPAEAVLSGMMILTDHMRGAITRIPRGDDRRRERVFGYMRRVVFRLRDLVCLSRRVTGDRRHRATHTYLRRCKYRLVSSVRHRVEPIGWILRSLGYCIDLVDRRTNQNVASQSPQVVVDRPVGNLPRPRLFRPYM